MVGVRMWLRATGKVLFPLMLAAQTIAMLNVQGVPGSDLPGWSFDWSWMLSVWTGSTILLSPLSAASVVLLQIRAWRPPGDDLVAGLPRALRSRSDMVWTVFLSGLAVQGAALLIASLCCVAGHADASGLTLPWQLFTGPCALLASTWLGAMVGEFWKDPWGVPVTAIGVFMFQNVFFWKGYPELLSTEMATGPVTGARPIPAHLMATCGSNLALALACACITLWHVRSRRQRRHLLLLLAGLALAAVVAIFHPFVASGALDTYEMR